MTEGDALLRCLDRQLELVTELTRIAEEKSRVIRERRMDRLVQLLHEEADAVQALACEEEGRVQLGARLGLEEGATLEQWLHKLSGDVRLPLEERAKTLREAVRRLQSLAAANDALVRQELSYIRFAIDLLAGPAPEDVTYGPARPGRSGEGKPAVSVSRSLFDFKA